MHMDYPNHYLTHPAPWDEPEAVVAIVYFDEVERCGGATRLVPRAGADDAAYAWPYDRMPGVGAHAWLNDRAAAEAYLQLYEPSASWQLQVIPIVPAAEAAERKVRAGGTWALAFTHRIRRISPHPASGSTIESRSQGVSQPAKHCAGGGQV